MAAFELNFVVEQSLNGKTLTFRDESNWSDNDEGYVKEDFERVFNVEDAYGNVFATLPLGESVDVTTFTVSTNHWLKTTFTATGPETFTLVQKQLFDRFTINKYREALNGADCCSKGTDLTDLQRADLFMTGVNFSLPLANGQVDVQKFEDNAYAFLNQ